MLIWIIPLIFLGIGVYAIGEMYDRDPEEFKNFLFGDKPTAEIELKEDGSGVAPRSDNIIRMVINILKNNSSRWYLGEGGYRLYLDNEIKLSIWVSGGQERLELLVDGAMKGFKIPRKFQSEMWELIEPIVKEGKKRDEDKEMNDIHKILK